MKYHTKFSYLINSHVVELKSLIQESENKKCICVNKMIRQGQTREYERITHFLPSPEEGHDFHKANAL